MKDYTYATGSEKLLHTQLGLQGELLALTYLKEQSYKILEHRCRRARIEVDIVACTARELIFVEVKSRCTHQNIFPELAVNSHKKRRYAVFAQAYNPPAYALPILGEAYTLRFDIISIDFREKHHHITHHRNAFYIDDYFNPKVGVVW